MPVRWSRCTALCRVKEVFGLTFRERHTHPASRQYSSAVSGMCCPQTPTCKRKHVFGFSKLSVHAETKLRMTGKAGHTRGPAVCKSQSFFKAWQALKLPTASPNFLWKEACARS